MAFTQIKCARLSEKCLPHGKVRAVHAPCNCVRCSDTKGGNFMHLPTLPLALFNNLMGMDGLIILVLGLLFFGRRLPEVGKNLGKTNVEFKKGLNGTYSKDEPAGE